MTRMTLLGVGGPLSAGPGPSGGNVFQGWKGAVEPAATGASGNECQLWKGAVEPAA